MAEFNKELLEKAGQAKSAEELVTIAKEYGLDITEDDAAAFFEESDKLGELSDDELDNVAGGRLIDLLYRGTKSKAMDLFDRGPAKPVKTDLFDRSAGDPTKPKTNFV